jgi:hypothetical protein
MKQRVIHVTDLDEIDRLLAQLDAPTILGGNTFDGLIVNADQLREWRIAEMAAADRGDVK